MFNIQSAAFAKWAGLVLTKTEGFDRKKNQVIVIVLFFSAITFQFQGLVYMKSKSHS